MGSGVSVLGWSEHSHALIVPWVLSTHVNTPNCFHLAQNVATGKQRPAVYVKYKGGQTVLSSCFRFPVINIFKSIVTCFYKLHKQNLDVLVPSSNMGTIWFPAPAFLMQELKGVQKCRVFTE